MQTESAHSGVSPAPRHTGVSVIGLAAMVAALHVAALGGRVFPRCPRGRLAAMLIWQQPEVREAEPHHDPDRAPSNPTRSYSAGRLALTAGMVIVALARQLQVMRVGAALAR